MNQKKIKYLKVIKGLKSFKVKYYNFQVEFRLGKLSGLLQFVTFIFKTGNTMY